MKLKIFLWMSVLVVDCRELSKYEKCADLCDPKFRFTQCIDSSNIIALSPLEECSHIYCESENVTHYYEWQRPNGSKILKPHLNYFERTYAGQNATMRDPCLHKNGLPVMRRCLGKSNWQEFSPTLECRKPLQKQLELSHELQILQQDILMKKYQLQETQGKSQVTTKLRSLLNQPHKKMLPFDVIKTEQILQELTREAKDVAITTDLMSIYNVLMKSDPDVLRVSAELNATNSLLQQFEDYMDALPQQLVQPEKCGTNLTRRLTNSAGDVEIFDYGDVGVQVEITSSLSVFFVNPECSHVTGLAIYSASGKALKPSHRGFWYRFLYANETVLALKTEHTLEAATFLSEELWTAVHAAGATYLVFKVYAHDALFVETSLKRRRRPRSKVLSISIPNFTAQLPHPLSFLLHNENHRKPDPLARPMDSGCGYWNYSTWLSDGVITSSVTDMLRDPVIICQTMHLTQFSFLLGGSYRINDLGEQVLIAPEHERVMDIISTVGCCLSLIGLLGIWLTAALFKSWRSQASTKVLLHLCLALTLQMILFVFLNTDHISEELVLSRDYARCVALGAAMQYSILVLFSWMLIIAFLQFQRYVTVIGIERPKHYILKAAIIAWVVPLLPTLLVAGIDSESYVPTAGHLATDTGFCYPSGYGLIFGVVLPVTLIIVANLVIFVYVFYSISHSLGQSMQRAERKLVMKQIRLSVLLFFLLGLSWIFGVFAFMQAGIVFSYLFCLTATLQGLVLFVYFVLLDEGNRRSWLELCRPGKTARDSKIRIRDLQSMTHNTTSSIESSRSQH